MSWKQRALKHSLKRWFFSSLISGFVPESWGRMENCNWEMKTLKMNGWKHDENVGTF